MCSMQCNVVSFLVLQIQHSFYLKANSSALFMLGEKQQQWLTSLETEAAGEAALCTTINDGKQHFYKV